MKKPITIALVTAGLLIAGTLAFALLTPSRTDFAFLKGLPSTTSGGSGTYNYVVISGGKTTSSTLNADFKTTTYKAKGNLREFAERMNKELTAKGYSRSRDFLPFSGITWESKEGYKNGPITQPRSQITLQPEDRFSPAAGPQPLSLRFAFPEDSPSDESHDTPLVIQVSHNYQPNLLDRLRDWLKNLRP